ncbi:MAG: DUF2029 domain-containing protein [Acidobacteria bacterium]|nr:DUF2029 domain-containing protein [Acidobacteriota bacterium]
MRHPKFVGTTPATKEIQMFHRRIPGSHAQLLIVGATMEVLYVGILSLSNLKENVETFILLALAQGALYLCAVYIAERVPPRRLYLVLVFAAAVIFRLTLFPLPPSLSDDLYRYQWDAKAQNAGYNPYLARPDDKGLEFLRDGGSPTVSGPEYSTLYGPVMEEVFWISFALLPSGMAMKLLFLLLDLGVVLVLFRLLPILGISPMRAVIYAWSPLIIIEFAASGHNDPLPILALALSLLWHKKGKGKLSLAALSVSALSKIYAGFLIPLFLLRNSWRLFWIPAALTAVAFLPYGEGWKGLFAILSRYANIWKNNESLFRLLRWITANDSQAGKLYLILVTAVVLYCLVRKLSPERGSYLILGAILLFSPNVFPWYVSWIVPLLVIYPNPAWLLFTVTVFLSYHVLIPYHTLGLWREDGFFTFLEYAPFYGWLIATFGGRMLPRWILDFVVSVFPRPAGPVEH